MLRAVWPVLAMIGCATPRGPATTVANTSAPRATASGAQAPWGTAHPYRIVEVPPDGRWAVICQARADTDGDGKIAIGYEMHGELKGDLMLAYLIDPSGGETIIDNFLGADPSGRWLAIVEHGAPVLIDAATWHRTPMIGTLPQFRITRGVADWSFAPTGHRLLYVRDGAAIVRDLETGRERTIARSAWQAAWSGDGSWVELQMLGGDTNHDGYTHGPDLQPSEGIPGGNCGHKFDWGDPLVELQPVMTDSAKVQAALDSIANPDDLTDSLWRVSDGVVTPGERALDHDTIVTKRADGSLAVGKLGVYPRAIPSGCRIESVFVPAATIVLQCELPTGAYSIRWWHGDEDHELYQGPIEPTILGDDTGFFEIWTKPSGSFYDSATGRMLARHDRTYRAWSDDDHLLTRSDTPSPFELFVRGQALPLELPVGDDDTAVKSTGHYLAVGTLRIDLHTLARVALSQPPIAVRIDGAILVDGGPASSDPDERIHLGPLRWITP